jgi:hypothetical protein
MDTNIIQKWPEINENRHISGIGNPAKCQFFKDFWPSFEERGMGFVEPIAGSCLEPE